MEALCENKMCEIAKYLCYFSKYLSIIAEQSGVDPGECQERSGYYMISEQSVNTLKLSHPTILLDFFLLPDWDWEPINLLEEQTY